jgi:hypothetical protein
LLRRSIFWKRAARRYRTLSYMRARDMRCGSHFRRTAPEYHACMRTEALIEALEDLLGQIEDMGDPGTGRLSPGERDHLRQQLDRLWAQRDAMPLDDLGIALFERARRIVDGAPDS